MMPPGARWLAGLTLLFAGACTRILDYPGVSPEDDDQACGDGIDNDLNGEMDCADPSCVLLCPKADVVEPVSITPCFAEGEYAFRQVVPAGGLETICEPFPPDPPACPRGEALLPVAGTQGCTRLGNTCPTAGLFPSGLPTSGVAYVRAGATGTGTSGSPFGTIAEALLTSASTIAIAAGTYNEDLVIDRAVEIVGACPTQVALEGSAFEAPVAQVSAAGAVLRQVTISPTSGTGIEVQANGVLSLEDSEVRGLAGVGVDVLGGGNVTLDHVAFADLAGVASVGVRVGASGMATIVGSRFDRVDGLAIGVSGILEASAVVVTTSADGVRVDQGGLAAMRGMDLEPGGGIALEIDCGDDTSTACATLDDSLVRDPGTGGKGLQATSGRVDVRRTLFSGLLGWGIFASGGVVELEDVIVRSTRPELGNGAGILVTFGSTVRANRLRLRGNLFVGVNVIGGTIIFNDFELDGDQQTGTSGVGVHGSDGANVIFMRFSIRSAGICALELAGELSFLGVEGVISDTARGACVEGDAVTVANLTNLITYIGNGENIFVP